MATYNGYVYNEMPLPTCVARNCLNTAVRRVNLSVLNAYMEVKICGNAECLQAALDKLIKYVPPGMKK